METADANEKEKRRKRRIMYRGAERTDMPLLIVTLVMVVFGLIMMYSASFASALYMFGDGFYYIDGQTIFAAIGIVVMMVLSRINYRILHRFAWLILAASFLLLCITLFMPPLNDSRRWIIIGNFTFQPSEAVKFAVILIVSHLASVDPAAMQTRKYGFYQFVVILGLVVGVMALQPHLSGAIIIILLMLILMFIGGTKGRWFGLAAAVGAPLGTLVLFATDRFRYAMDRVNVWLYPLEHIGSGGYQTFQSLVAIGSGGLLGLGLGNSRQKHLYLPEQHNDFIFAIICEELGYIGAVFVILLFVFFVYRGFSIALRARDRFGSMLAIGTTLQIGIQAFLNIAVVTNTIPNTGISLPFFSQGGTSLVVLLAEVGVLLSVSRFSNIEPLRPRGAIQSR